MPKISCPGTCHQRITACFVTFMACLCPDQGQCDTSAHSLPSQSSKHSVAEPHVKRYFLHVQKLRQRCMRERLKKLKPSHLRSLI